MSEKVGGAEGTKLDEDFKELEKVFFFVELQHMHKHKF